MSVCLPKQRLTLMTYLIIFSNYLLRFMNTRVHVRKSEIFVSTFIQNSDTVAGTGAGCGYWTDVTKTGNKFFGKLVVKRK
jgi:hypothetical protein